MTVLLSHVLATALVFRAVPEPQPLADAVQTDRRRDDPIFIVALNENRAIIEGVDRRAIE